MGKDARRELIGLTQRLLDAISTGDWGSYRDLCAPDLTCFEPEAKGQVVEGLAFHEFYFRAASKQARVANTICSPVVRSLGPDAAVVVYSRLVQRGDSDGRTTHAQFEETRVWHRIDGRWLHVHFHRSQNG